MFSAFSCVTFFSDNGELAFTFELFNGNDPVDSNCFGDRPCRKIDGFRIWFSSQ